MEIIIYTIEECRKDIPSAPLSAEGYEKLIS